MLVAKSFDERAPGFVVADYADWQHVDTEVCQVADCIGRSARNDSTFAMFQNQDWSLARDAGDFAKNKFVRQKVAEHGDRHFREGLDDLFQPLAQSLDFVEMLAHSSLISPQREGRTSLRSNPSFAPSGSPAFHYLPTACAVALLLRRFAAFSHLLLQFRLCPRLRHRLVSAADSRRGPALSNATAIFSRLAPSLRNHGEHGIHSVSCVGEFHLYRDNGQRSKCGQISAQIDRVFFCSHKTVGLTALPQGQ